MTSAAITVESLLLLNQNVRFLMTTSCNEQDLRGLAHRCVLCFTSDCRGTQKLMVKETSNLTCETNFTTKTSCIFGISMVATCTVKCTLVMCIRNVTVARGAWFSEVCSGRKTQETAVSKWVKCKMRNTCL